MFWITIEDIQNYLIFILSVCFIFRFAFYLLILSILFFLFSSGRNLYEVLRYYDALDTTINHKVVTPCNWGQGQDVFINNEVPVEQTKQYRYFEMKPWFKLTPCPENS